MNHVNTDAAHAVRRPSLEPLGCRLANGGFSIEATGGQVGTLMCMSKILGSQEQEEQEPARDAK